MGYVYGGSKKEDKDKNSDFRELADIELSMDWDELMDSETDESEQLSVTDALVRSMCDRGRVDIAYIAELSGRDKLEVISELREHIYQNPATFGGSYFEGWETSDEYLSGNIYKKLRDAMKACREYGQSFERNVTALRKICPATLGAEDIYVTTGSPWIPTDVIEDFIVEYFGFPQGVEQCVYEDKGEGRFKTEVHYISYGHGRWEARQRSVSLVVRDDITGVWEINFKNAFTVARSSKRKGEENPFYKYGTYDVPALTNLEKALNQQNPDVYDVVYSETNKNHRKRVLNREKTLLATERQKELIALFKEWIWKDEDRKNRLINIYMEKFGYERRRIYNGDFLEFPGMSPEVQLYDYQKNAVARILYSPNTLLAHEVGSGKTYIMIAAGMEQRRMGLSSKNMYVVPNNIVGQWRSIFLSMYPDAKLLVVEPKTFKPDVRQKILKEIRDGDYDGIIIAYSSFGLIPLSKKVELKELLDEIDRIVRALKDPKNDTSRLRDRLSRLKTKVEKLEQSGEYKDDEEDRIYFEHLGITGLYVDEAHNFKNVSIRTSMSNVPGISATGSAKCDMMMNKVHYVQRCNMGRGVVFATGTPITNSLTDIYVMQLYLQGGVMSQLELYSFDNWVANFAEREEDFEVDVDTNSYRMRTRFREFHNLPELTALLAQIADFHSMDDSADVPKTDGYNDTLIRRSSQLGEYLQYISERVEAIRSNGVRRTVDNMLKVTTDGRKAALDIRLASKDGMFSRDSKVYRCAENVYREYKASDDIRGTQLVFCDISTPKEGFNLYDELRNILINMGIPAEEIAFVHSAGTEAERTKLYKRVCDGKIRVLLGSTLKLGIGVNVQERMVALHHLDVPWRPADMIQRNGRILRQGNINEKVRIYRYITEGSFDAYSWQLLEVKQKIIHDILAGSMPQRYSDDVEDTVLDYGEVKALAIGNPLIKTRVEISNELSRQATLQTKYLEEHIGLRAELDRLPRDIRNQEELIRRCIDDIDFVDSMFAENDETSEAVEDTEEYSADSVEDYDEAYNAVNYGDGGTLTDLRRLLNMEIERALAAGREEVAEKTFIMEYRGFKVFTPGYINPKKRFVIISREGTYTVKIGDKMRGYATRIDNAIRRLNERLEKLRDGLEEKKARKSAIEAQLSSDAGYADRIRELKERLRQVDAELEEAKKEAEKQEQ